MGTFSVSYERVSSSSSTEVSVGRVMEGGVGGRVGGLEALRCSLAL